MITERALPTPSRWRFGIVVIPVGLRNGVSACILPEVRDAYDIWRSLTA